MKISATRKAAMAAGLLCLSVAALAQAEITQKGTLRVSFGGKIAPQKLPRTGEAPVAVSISGDITTTDKSAPPQLRTITMSINRNGHLNHKGLPVCGFSEIQPSSSAEAREVCASSLVGTGTFRAAVELPEQSPFPSNGKVLAFNGKQNGKPVIFAHIYGTEPLPTSFTLPFALRQKKGGQFATTLVAQLPRVAANWGYVSGVSLTLKREFKYRGKSRSYLSAGCPAPKGFPGASFTFARASFAFENGKTLTSRMTRNCQVRK